jgi:hypothetical protein
MNRYYKRIENFENYFISKNGSVYSNKSNKYIKHNNDYVVLWKDGKKFTRSISKLISDTFNLDNDIKEGLIDFKPIVGFENYLINKDGNIFSFKIKGYKKFFINPYGYKCIFLSKNGKVHGRFVHRLVYETWIGNITGDLTVDHIDENKSNNNIKNLQLLTRSENVLKFHYNRNRKRYIKGFIKIDNFDNYYVNKQGQVISFKYDENYSIIYNDGKNGVYLRKNNKRYYVNINNLLYKYFGIKNIQKNRKYKNLNDSE